MTEVMDLQSHLHTQLAAHRDKPKDDMYLALYQAMCPHEDNRSSFNSQHFVEFFRGPRRFWAHVAVFSGAPDADHTRGLRWVWRLVAHPKQVTATEDWWGRVVSVDTDEGVFAAELVAASDEMVEQLAEFSMDDVAPEEQQFVTEGATFRWLAFYTETPSGRIYQSVLRFDRESPTLTVSDANRAFAQRLAFSFRGSWEAGKRRI
ncbi:MAG: hypothetical protein QOI95_2893 [Acidimicrobiaceae bacterium]|jgi:hypothetical protein